MQLGRIYVVETDPATQFTGALATNAIELEDVEPDMAIGASPDCRLRVVGIVLIADQNLAWELTFWRKKIASGAASVAVDSFAGAWAFAAADGKQIAGAGSYRYAIFGLDIPYTDDDAAADRLASGKGRIHLGLVNRDAVAKDAGAAGEIKVVLYVDPTQG